MREAVLEHQISMHLFGVGMCMNVRDRRGYRAMIGRLEGVDVGGWRRRTRYGQASERKRDAQWQSSQGPPKALRQFSRKQSPCFGHRNLSNVIHPAPHVAI